MLSGKSIQFSGCGFKTRDLQSLTERLPRWPVHARFFMLRVYESDLREHQFRGFYEQLQRGEELRAHGSVHHAVVAA